LAINPAERFTLFYGGVFSQWYYSPFVIDGIRYDCAEQYMMAAKAALFKDYPAVAKIMATCDPAEQKRLGKKVKKFDKTTWEAVAMDVVARASMAKFTSSKELLQALLVTHGTTLVEASPTDVIWGIGLSEVDPKALDRSEWLGLNWLGRVLTETREQLLDAVAYVS
jgi:hypothetical protein